MKDITELRKERQLHRLSQTDVARIMGTTQSALSRAERDGNPTQDFLQRYESALRTLDTSNPSESSVPADTTSTDSFSPLEIAAIRLIVAKLVERYNIAEMYVFGSVARGDERPDSDVDLLYRFSSGASHSMMTMRQLTDDLERALGRKVSLTSYDSLLRNAQRSRASRRFLDHIREDMVKGLMNAMNTDTSMDAYGNATPRHRDQTFRDQTTLIRLLEHLDYAIEDAHGAHSPDELFANRVLLNSVAMEMTQVQECARLLSDDYRHAMPELPWNELRALRNVFVHDYDEIDVESLYDTVTTDAPALAERLRPIVEAID